MKKQRRVVIHILALLLVFYFPLTVFGEEDYQSSSSVGFYGEYTTTFGVNDENKYGQNIVPDDSVHGEESHSHISRLPRLGDNHNILLYNVLVAIIITFLFLKYQEIKNLERVNLIV